MNISEIINQLIIDEGFRAYPYTDTVGKLTIGIGRNLTDVGLTRDEAIFLAQNDIKKVCDQLDQHLPWWRSMSEPRQQVLVNMAFNMGVNGLLSFHQTLTKMQGGDYNGAADGMALSKWAGQVGPRAVRLIAKMRAG